MKNELSKKFMNCQRDLSNKLNCFYINNTPFGLYKVIAESPKMASNILNDKNKIQWF